MSSVCGDQMKGLSVKAGDIVATQGASASSLFIRAATVSKWSHVGIAIDEDEILEAVKNSDSSVDSQHQVRVVPVSTFVADKSLLLHCIRPEILSGYQLAHLKSFANSSSGKGYTKMHAVFTAIIPLTKVIFSLLAIFSTVNLWNDIPQSGRGTNFFVSALFINGIIYISYLLLTWSSRCEWGVKTAESIFRKCGWGNWLVERKYEMFCSRLVLLADKEVGGQIDVHTTNEYEVQPKHIVDACKRLGWQFVDVQVNTRKNTDSM